MHVLGVEETHVFADYMVLKNMKRLSFLWRASVLREEPKLKKELPAWIIELSAWSRNI